MSPAEIDSTARRIDPRRTPPERAGMSSHLPDCFYCRKDQRLHDLMIEVAPLAVSTLYLFREQTHRGRCVVAYRHHVNELFELPDAEVALFMQDVARAARAMQAAFRPGKINYGAYSDKLPHLHFHLVPKYPDGAAWGSPFAMMPEPRRHLTEEGYAELIAALRAKLDLPAPLALPAGAGPAC